MADLETNTRARRVEPVTLMRWAVFSPNSDHENFPPQDTIAKTADEAWERFCYPALRREGYEADGFMARKVKLTIEVVE